MYDFILYYNWLKNYDFYFEILFAIVTLLVSVYAFKVYRLCKQRELALFGLAFSSISLSYWLWAALHIASINELNDITSFVELQHAAILSYLGIYLHVIFLLAGLATLAYVTLKVHNLGAYAMLLSLSLFPFIMLQDKFQAVYLLSSILLIFIIFSYFLEYYKRRNSNTLLIAISFVLLFLGRFDFLFVSPDEKIYYLIGHVLEFVAYTAILTSLILVINNGKKAK